MVHAANANATKMKYRKFVKWPVVGGTYSALVSFWVIDNKVPNTKQTHILVLFLSLNNSLVLKLYFY